MIAVVVAAGLDESSIRKKGTRRAPGVGLHGEGSESVGADVVEDGVSGAVDSAYQVGGIVPTPAAGKRDVGGAEIGAVEHDDLAIT